MAGALIRGDGAITGRGGDFICSFVTGSFGRGGGKWMFNFTNASASPLIALSIVECNFISFASKHMCTLNAFTRPCWIIRTEYIFFFSRNCFRTHPRILERNSASRSFDFAKRSNDLYRASVGSRWTLLWKTFISKIHPPSGNDRRWNKKMTM